MDSPLRSIALAPLLAFAIALSASSASKDMTFYLPFDGSVRATRAAGSPAARIYGKEGYTEGVVGQAVVVGGKRRLAYAGAKNIPTAAGSICFWARPLDWTPTTDKFVFFVALLSQHDKRLARLMLYKLHNTSSLLVLAQSLGASVSRQLHSPAASWQTNEWRHFALTWSPQRIALYVNGELSAQAPGVEPPDGGWQQLVVGTTYPSWAYVGEERTAIDELRVFGRALAAEEARSAFAHALSKNEQLAAVFEDRRKQREKRRAGNLVRAGGYVLASSFMDYKDHYPDNLIDGDPNSIWRPQEAEFPQWIELRWRYPVRINKVAFEEVPPHAVTAASVVSFHNGYAGERTVTLKLPGPRTVTDALSAKSIANNAVTFDLHLPECTTRVLRLSP